MRVLLCIVDGFGYSKDVSFNPLHHANTPFIDSLFAGNFALLRASGVDVGVPDGQVGNSEVGHMTIGSGRIIKQDLVRISEEIVTIDSNAVFQQLIQESGDLHIIGLLSDGGVHSHIDHIAHLYDAIKGLGKKVFVHAITDGRDTSPKSAVKYMDRAITSIAGRYYAMDRDNNNDRTSKYYSLLTALCGEHFSNCIEYIEDSYSRNVYDEFIVPAYKIGFRGIKKEDGIIISNFRADRIRQIAEMFIENGYINMASMSGCSKELDKKIPILFPRKAINGSLGQILSEAGYKQLRMAETEKYAHVTYFLNCGLEAPLIGEDRILINSPKVATYDLMPQMSAYELTDKLIHEARNYDFICVNFANLDMVGHTGNFEAAKTACEVIDQCLNKICTNLKGLDILITSDHGNIESLFDTKNNQQHTAHTINPVPLFYVGNKNIKMKNGALYDIAPTILKIMNLPQAHCMSGIPLF